MKRAVALLTLIVLLVCWPALVFAQSPTPTGADTPPEERRAEPTERFVYVAVALFGVLLGIIGLSYVRTVVRSTGAR